MPAARAAEVDMKPSKEELDRLALFFQIKATEAVKNMAAGDPVSDFVREVLTEAYASGFEDGMIHAADICEDEDGEKKGEVFATLIHKKQEREAHDR